MTKNITEQIDKLKKEKNAIILAHYYANPETQALADYVGDSFYLAKVAKNTHADILVFCGVRFMGESAKILNPEKKVLMPDLTADCPMAHMVKDGLIDEMRAKYKDLAVVCYINSTAELKCKSDICVTSSNAVNIIRKLQSKNILFIPDKNLGSYVAKQVPEKNIILNDGCCPIHASITAKEVSEQKEKHPYSPVFSHPECPKDVLDLSDKLGSTAEIINFVKESPADSFIICTEDGVNFKLKSDNPNKEFFFPKSCHCCSDMKLNSPEKILEILKTETNEVVVNKETAEKALCPLNKMLELAK